MKKVYESHEEEYKRMEKEGIKSWFLRSSDNIKKKEIDANTERFLIDTISQDWFPKEGKVVELGCGTAPILRWFNDNGYNGTGIDLSYTAISMAKELCKQSNLDFYTEDICNLKNDHLKQYDIAIDSNCLHCITEENDRINFIKNVHKILKSKGIFIVLTMCSPINRSLFKTLYPSQKLISKKIYMHSDNLINFEENINISGNNYIPTRYIVHWQEILKEIKLNGFEEKILRVNKYTDKEAISFLSLVLIKKDIPKM